jgi:hypothetical protein
MDKKTTARYEKPDSQDNHRQCQPIFSCRKPPPDDAKMIAAPDQKPSVSVMVSLYLYLTKLNGFVFARRVCKTVSGGIATGVCFTSYDTVCHTMRVF